MSTPIPPISYTTPNGPGLPLSNKVEFHDLRSDKVGGGSASIPVFVTPVLLDDTGEVRWYSNETLAPLNPGVEFSLKRTD